MTAACPVAMTIAGSDSGGGAGIQADLKTFSALRVYGCSVVTAVTAQNTQSVTAVHEVPADVVQAQIESVLDDLTPGAIKIGMLFSAAIVRAVATALEDYRGAIVLDPVMISTSGDALLQDTGIAAMMAELLPRADLLTPNIPEAARLLNTNAATNLQAVEIQGRALLALGPQAVLMKGGHSQNPICTDLLLTGDGVPATFSALRISTRNTHGTGCTYSAAIAAAIARGQPLQEATHTAHQYVHNAIANADDLDIGKGQGPVHHFHEMWD